MPIDDQDEQEQPTPRLPTEKEQGPSNEQEFMPVQPSTVSESNPSPILADKANIEIFDESKMHSQSKDVDPIEDVKLSGKTESEEAYTSLSQPSQSKTPETSSKNSLPQKGSAETMPMKGSAETMPMASSETMPTNKQPFKQPSIDDTIKIETDFNITGNPQSKSVLVEECNKKREE